MTAIPAPDLDRVTYAVDVGTGRPPSIAGTDLQVEEQNLEIQQQIVALLSDILGVLQTMAD